MDCFDVSIQKPEDPSKGLQKFASVSPNDLRNLGVLGALAVKNFGLGLEGRQWMVVGGPASQVEYHSTAMKWHAVPARTKRCHTKCV